MLEKRAASNLGRWFAKNPMRFVVIQNDRVTVNGEKVMMMGTFLHFVRPSKPGEKYPYRLRKWVKRECGAKCPRCGR